MGESSLPDGQTMMPRNHPRLHVRLLSAEPLLTGGYQSTNVKQFCFVLRHDQNMPASTCARTATARGAYQLRCELRIPGTCIKASISVPIRHIVSSLAFPAPVTFTHSQPSIERSF